MLVDLGGLDDRIGRERTDLDTVEPIGGPGGREVVGDVRRLTGKGVGLHPKLLDHRRVDHSGADRHQKPRRGRSDGKSPSLPPEVDDQGHRCQHRDRNEQPQGGEPGGYIGEPGPEELRGTGRIEQAVGIDLVQAGPEQSQDRKHQGEVHLGAAGKEGAPPTPQTKGAVEVMGCCHSQGRDQNEVEAPHQQVAQ